MLQFLDDYAKRQEHGAIARWYSGTMTDPDSHESRGRALAAREFSNLSWDDLAAFYGFEAEKEDKK